MNISDKLTQEKLLEILTDSYIKGQGKENIRVADLLDEMKKKVMVVVNTNK
jgi:hypothetical protein